jgi:hypothetical protein
VKPEKKCLSYHTARWIVAGPDQKGYQLPNRDSTFSTRRLLIEDWSHMLNYMT